MNFAEQKSAAELWLLENKDTYPLLLISANESDNQLVFQVPDTTYKFYVDCSEELHVCSDNDDILIKLQPVIEWVTSSANHPISEVLRRSYVCLKPVLEDCGADEKDDDSEDCGADEKDDDSEDCGADEKDDDSEDCGADEKDDDSEDCGADEKDDDSEDCGADEKDDDSEDCGADEKDDDSEDCGADEKDDDSEDCGADEKDDNFEDFVEEDDASEDSEEDYVDDYVDIESEDDDNVKLVDENGNAFAPSSFAERRLIKDLEAMENSSVKDEITGHPRGNNLCIWDVKLTNIPKDSKLGNDLDNYSQKYDIEPVISIEMQLPGDFPYSPPVIRVIRPRIIFATDLITDGGHICMEMLTKSGWTPVYDIENILVDVRCQIISDPDASIDMSNQEYTEGVDAQFEQWLLAYSYSEKRERYFQE